MKKLISLGLALAMVLSLAACGNNSASSASGETAAASTEETSAPAKEAAQAEETASTEEASAPAEENDEPYTFGFVMPGMGNEFFEGIVAAVLGTMEEAGWEASYVSGEYDVSKQIEAIENYTAQEVDVLMIFPVAAEALSAAVQQASDAGVKIITMVEPVEVWDGFLSSDNYVTGVVNAWMAAQYIEENYPDAEPGSVPLALIYQTDTPTNEEMSKGMEVISEMTDKVNVIKYEIGGQDKEYGMEAAENLYVSNPEIKLFLCASNVVALGVDSYFTGLSSPVAPEDLSEYAAWGTNASEETLAAILASKNNESILRGINVQAGINETARCVKYLAEGLMDGSIEKEEIPATIYIINADNVEDYIANGEVSLQWDYEAETAVEK